MLRRSRSVLLNILFIQGPSIPKPDFIPSTKKTVALRQVGMGGYDLRGGGVGVEVQGRGCRRDI